MERRQAWIATAALIVTVILSAIGATWVVGRNMATREDVAELRNEMRAGRQSAEAQIQELRNEIRAGRESADAEMQELRNEIRAGRESADAQMQELRGYIVQHLDQHGNGGQ